MTSAEGLWRTLDDSPAWGLWMILAVLLKWENFGALQVVCSVAIPSEVQRWSHEKPAPQLAFTGVDTNSSSSRKKYCSKTVRKGLYVPSWKMDKNQVNTRGLACSPTKYTYPWNKQTLVKQGRKTWRWPEPLSQGSCCGDRRTRKKSASVSGGGWLFSQVEQRWQHEMTDI